MKLLKQLGFSLLEAVMYIAIAVMVLLVLVNISAILLENYHRNQFVNGVHLNSLQTMERIRHEITLATAINSITTASDQGSISLTNPDSLINPVIISVVDVSGQKRLAIKYAGGANTYLTDSRVNVDSFYLTNYSSANGKTENVQFVLKLSTYNPGGQKRIVNYSVTATSSVELIGI